MRHTHKDCDVCRTAGRHQQARKRHLPLLVALAGGRGHRTGRDPPIGRAPVRGATVFGPAGSVPARSAARCNSGTFLVMSAPVGPRVLRYEVVKDLVLSMIEEQNLAPGDRLPSTAELAELSGVSQISVRRALDELERAGRIQRHQGVGTFVASPRILSDPARSGTLLTTLGEVPYVGPPATSPGPERSEAKKSLTTELIGIRVGLPGANIASALGIEEGQPVWEVVRRRLMGGAPAIIERAILPLHRVPSLDHAILAAGGSLYSHLADKHGLVDAYEEQYLEVTLPSAEERAWLALPAREQVVAIKGVSFDETGQPFDCFQQVYPARRFAFFFSGSQTRRLLTARNTTGWTVTPLPGS